MSRYNIFAKRGYLARTMFSVLLIFSNFAYTGTTDRYLANYSFNQLFKIADFSFMNKPLTINDTIHVCDTHFCTQGNDGIKNTEDDAYVRLFGINLVWGANFPDTKEAELIAQRFAKLGFNIVRIHNIDRYFKPQEQSPSSILSSNGFPKIELHAAKRLKYFIRTLKNNGIYVNLNLNVSSKQGRNINEGYLFKSNVKSKKVDIIGEENIADRIEFINNLLKELDLVNSPSLAMLEINNESSLMYYWITNTLTDHLSSKQINEIVSTWSRTNNKLDFNYEWLSPLSKINPPDAFLELLIDKDRKYFERIRNAIHHTVNRKVPVTGTQMNFGGLSNFYSNINMDYLDTHFYMDHYKFNNSPFNQYNWYIQNTSNTQDGISFLHNAALLRDHSKPFCLSEFNQPWPNTFGQEIFPLVAVYASRQDWDCLIYFSYSHSSNSNLKGPNAFDLVGEKNKWVNIGQSAWLFRTYKIPSIDNLHVINISQEEAINAAKWRETGFHLYKYLSKINKLSGISPLDFKVGVNPRPIISRQEPLQVKSTSNKLQTLTWKPMAQQIIIDSDYAIGAFGWLNRDQTITIKNFKFSSNNPGKSFIATLITSHDELPIIYSNDLIMSSPSALLPSSHHLLNNSSQHLKKHPQSNGFTILSSEKDGKLNDRISSPINNGNNDGLLIPNTFNTIIFRSNCLVNSLNIDHVISNYMNTSDSVCEIKSDIPSPLHRLNFKVIHD